MFLFDRLATALAAAVFGAIYGVMIAIGYGFFTDGEFRPEIVYDATAVFAALGFVMGGWVGDLLGLTLHLVLGILSGVFSGYSNHLVDPPPRAEGVARALFVLGLGTGIGAFVWWRYF